MPLLSLNPMSSTRIIFVRHGETIWNREGRCQGSSDIPLSEIGHEQATTLAAALARESVVAVYSSDLVRARQTADAVAAPHRLPVLADAGGESMRAMQARAGRALDEIVRRHPDQACIVVGHGLCIRALLCRFLEIDLNRFRCFRLENASVQA